MSKLIIIEGNSNDKDNVRNYMVKGERGDDGVSPTVETSKTGDTATITITDVEGEHEVQLKDGVSPTVEISKTDKVTTITIIDAEGTHTATINDGEVNVVNTFDTVLDPTKTAPSLNATENYVEDFVEAYDNNKFAYVDITENSITQEFLQRTFSYPSGFNMTNCVVVGLQQIKYEDDNTTIKSIRQEAGYNYYDDQGSNFDVFTFRSDGILTTINTTTYDKKLTFRLVLMKIS